MNPQDSKPAAAKPVIPLPTPDQVPSELRPLKRWCAFRFEYDPSKKKFRKPPASPVTGEAIAATDKYKEHRRTFDEALEGARKFQCDGLGFVLGDGYIGIDFDDCRQGDVIDPAVQNWLQWFPTYQEVSVSGTGIHCIGKGKIAKAVTATEVVKGGRATWECYAKDRYFTFTGQRIGDKLTIGDCQIGLDKLLATLGSESPQPEADNTQRPMSVDSARRIHQDNLTALRNAKQGEGNALLNSTAFFAGRAFAAGALEGTERMLKRELLDIVTKEWSKPHPEHGASQTIESGWHSGIAQPLKLLNESLVIRCLDDVEEKPVEWLWPNRIPLSAVSAFTGNPDTGKTMAYCDLVARVTTNRDFPDAKMPDGVAGQVIMLCAEDDYSRVIKPRLIAAGADTSAIFLIEKVEIRQGARRDERMFALDTDLTKLEEELEEKDSSLGSIPQTYALIVIDPVSSYFGKGNMNSKQDVRAVFNRLTSMCEHHRVTVLVVEHFNKRVDVNAIHKMGGSVALTAATRAAFMFANVQDEDGQYVMHFIKGNFAKRKTGLRFTFGDKEVESLGVDPETRKPYRVPYIIWGVEDQGTADDVLRSERGASEDNRAARAAKFLAEYLTEERPSKDVESEAEKRNISHNALWQAKKDLEIKAVRHDGQWYWKPQPTASQPPASSPTGQEDIPF